MSLPPDTSLPRTMQAVVCYGPQDYRLEERPVPQPGPEEVVVRVKLAGICASDLKCYLGAAMFWGDDQRSGYCQPPVTPGHEFVGEVAALGSGAGEKYSLQVGDLAISEQIVPCGECRFCRNGQYWMCQFGDVYGFRQSAFGAMAEYMLFPHKSLNYKVPATMPLQQAVLIEPLSCSIHAVDRGEIKPGDVVVVAGCGPLGLGMVAAARLKKPGLLVALDLRDHRLSVARACGADLCVNPSKVDAVDEIRKLTEGYGCDVYIEATGDPLGRDTRLADDPQAGHVRRVQRSAPTGDNGLDDHWRHERDQYSWRSFGTILLSTGNLHAGKGAYSR